MNAVRWGLLSTARINRRLIPAIRDSKRGKLAAVASRDSQRAKDYARKWDIPQAFGSYQDMLESGDLDAVYISLPNHLHAEWTIKAMQAGIHVLCEKPFAVSLEDVDEVIRVQQQTQTAVAEAFMYRHHPQTKQVREFVNSGKLGAITAVQGIFTFLMGDRARSPESLNVRMVPEFGGGCLWDVGIYPLSFTQYLLGEPPHWVSGFQVTGPTGIDEVFNGQMKYQVDSGKEILAQISGSFNAPYHTKMEIIGQDGRLEITRPFNNITRAGKVLFTDSKDRTRTLKVPRKSLYLGEVEDLQAAILDGKKPLISLQETRNHILTTLALFQSARTGEVVKLVDFDQGR
ncbi:MAG: Gfo/Idh/MocA family oxidoreductase [Anaerolineales bacterium]